MHCFLVDADDRPVEALCSWNALPTGWTGKWSDHEREWLPIAKIAPISG